jgi:microcompartment protein CcmL/EutN
VKVHEELRGEFGAVKSFIVTGVEDAHTNGDILSSPDLPRVGQEMRYRVANRNIFAMDDGIKRVVVTYEKVEG